MRNIIETLESEALKTGIPDFVPGDTVVVQVRVKEGNRERLQAYEGVVIARRNRGLHSSFTVRKMSYGEGVERIFPVHSPIVTKVDVVRQGRVRRAKLYYLRSKKGKFAKVEEREFVGEGKAAAAAKAAEPAKA